MRPEEAIRPALGLFSDLVRRCDDAGPSDGRERHSILVQHSLVGAVGNQFLENALHHLGGRRVPLLDRNAQRQYVIHAGFDDEFPLTRLLVIASCGGIVEARVGAARQDRLDRVFLLGIDRFLDLRQIRFYGVVTLTGLQLPA